MQTNHLSEPLIFEPSPSKPPPLSLVGPVGWLKENMFNGWFNSILSCIGYFVSCTGYSTASLLDYF